MKKSSEDSLITKYENLVQKAAKDSGINLNLSRPFSLTPQDLVSSQAERRWAASRLLAKYTKEMKLIHSPQGGSVVQLNDDHSEITITSLVSNQELYLPKVSFLLDYQTKKWFSITVDMSSRQYEEKIETVTFGDSFSFAVSIIKYKLIEATKLSPQETLEAKNYFKINWLSGQNPLYTEINSWIEGVFRKNQSLDSAKSDLELRMMKSEQLLQSLLNKKAA